MYFSGPVITLTSGGTRKESRQAMKNKFFSTVVNSSYEFYDLRFYVFLRLPIPRTAKYYTNYTDGTC